MDSGGLNSATCEPCGPSLYVNMAVRAIRLGALFTESWIKTLLSARRKGPVILMYHRVIQEQSETLPPEPGMWVHTRTFEEQIDFLQDAFEIVPLNWLAKRLGKTKPLPEGTCAVTFDDGWLDTYTNALSPLSERGIPATLFIATGCVAGGQSPWTSDLWDALMALTGNDESSATPDWMPESLSNAARRITNCANLGLRRRLASVCLQMVKQLPRAEMTRSVDYFLRVSNWSPKDRQMLSWNEVMAMKNCGFDFGAHTRSHCILTGLQEAEIASEISNSKSDIEDVLGERVAAFSYPNGDMDATVRSAVIEAGFEFACGTVQAHVAEPLDLFALPRIGMHEGISSGLRSFSGPVLMARLGVL